MHDREKYNPTEILREFESNNDRPARYTAVAGGEYATYITDFIETIEQIAADHAKGAAAESCMAEVMNAVALHNEEWSPGCLVRAIIDSMSYGHVYALVNESMPGLYKIGFTTDLPSKRAEQLSSATGVPTPFRVLFYYGTINCQRVESGIHELLADKRINQSREFFRCTMQELGSAFESAITAEYASYGFMEDGPVLRETDYFPDCWMARNRCRIPAASKEKFMKPQSIDGPSD